MVSAFFHHPAKLVSRFGERITQAGVAGLYIICASSFLSPAGVSVGSGLLTVALIPLLIYRRVALSATTVAAASAFFVFIGFRHVAGLLHWTAGPEPDSGILKDWLQLLLFVPFAIFLQADARRLGRLLLLALASLVLGVLWRLDWSLTLEAPQRVLTMRQGFGLTAIGMALLAGTALIGLAALRNRWWQSPNIIASSPLRILFWVLPFVILTQIFVQAESRGSWLALLFSLGLSLAVGPRLKPRGATLGHAGKIIVASTAIAVVLLVSFSAERIAERWFAENELPSALIGGSDSNVPASSLKLRWHAQVAGIQLVKESPWVGAGPVSTRRLMQAGNSTNVRSEDGQVLKHLHNTYLEILVQFGTIGLLLFAALIVHLIRGLWLAAKRNRISADYAIFLLSAWTYSLAWAFFNFRALHQDWRVYWIILAGASLSWVLADHRAWTPRESEALH